MYFLKIIIIEMRYSMSIFLNFICLECENSYCDRMGITCMLLSPEIDESGKCLDFVDVGEGTSPQTTSGS